MNKHKAYWSQMHDCRKETSLKEKDFEEFEKQVELMFLKYDSVRVLEIIRNVYENTELKTNYFDW